MRVADLDRSLAFYGQLGFEPRGRLNFDSAYNHMALVVDDLDGLRKRLATEGVEPEKPPYGLGGTDSREEYRICFVSDPDGYRIELIDQAFPTPQDPPQPSTQR